MGDDTTIQCRSSPTLPRCPATLGDTKSDVDSDKKPLHADKTSHSLSPHSRIRDHLSLHQNEDCGYNFGDDPGLGAPSFPGTELVKKKSHHPEISIHRMDQRDSVENRDIVVFAEGGRERERHKMELIHLNRTCTSVDLATAFGLAIEPVDPSGVRCASDANLTDQEKVHKVRHQVSFAHTVADSLGGRTPFGHSDFLGALSRKSALREADRQVEQAVADQDDEQAQAVVDDEPEDDHDAVEDDGDLFDTDEGSDPSYLSDKCPEMDGGNCSYESCSRSGFLSHESDIDYLEVRPSLASTQLTELRGPNPTA